MAMSWRSWQWVPALALAFGGASAPAQSDADPATARLDQLIGDARCSTDRQCRVAGVGARPCGGPESYRAWSTRRTDARALDQWLQSYADKRRQAHERSGLLSTCQILPTPGARCERTGTGRGRCVLSATEAASPR